MASTIIIDVSTVPQPTPETWVAKPASSSKIAGRTTRKLLPVGPAFVAHARRVLGQKTFAEDDEEQAAHLARTGGASPDGEPEDDLGIGNEPEAQDLMFLDPKEWKHQDHYKVLGLSNLRINATLDQIRIAHRRKVLRHHPDKKAGSGNTDDDAFFKCIQKAFEVLSNPEKRRQFDSVDPHYLLIEGDVPTAAELTATPNAFYELLGPRFELEARFSKNPPAPPLGAPHASNAEVEAFYGYWYNFDSWRSFEYRDKEINEGSDSRDDKRYTEKKNKTERARLKKEDIARVRDLVDLAMGCDPRIKRIKQEEKAAREAKKKGPAKPGAKAPVSAAEEERKKAAEEQKRLEEEAAKNEAKKAKAAAANAAKKARRAARNAEEGGS